MIYSSLKNINIYDIYINCELGLNRLIV